MVFVIAPFYAGFLVAWTLVYLAAAGYCAWSAQRPKSDLGIGVLGAFFAALGVASGAAGAAMLASPTYAEVLSRLAHAALMPAPLLLVHFVRAEERSAHRSRFLAIGYGVAALLSVGATTGAFDLPYTGASHYGAASSLGKVAAVLFAGGVFAAAYYIARAPKISKPLGIAPFLGACFLFLCSVYDCLTALASTPRPSLSLGGFTAFTLTLFMGQIVRLAQLREHLVAKTDELSKKSRNLSKSFRELRARQDELVRKEQLAAIGELSAVVAHEVRNPLAIISNAVATLRRTNVDDESRKTLLGILSEEGARLNQLVGDLLHYAKPLAIERRSVDLHELVTRSLTAALGDKPNVGLEITQPVGLPAVGGDPLLLRQAIDNVVNNAIQAMSNNGTLTVQLSSAMEDLGAVLVIRDTGEGMDTVVRSRALDPFFTTRPSGTGLGLAIVSRVVDAHGGKVTIRSERGFGTEVRIYLPGDRDEPPLRKPGKLLPLTIEPFSSKESAPKKGGS